MKNDSRLSHPSSEVHTHEMDPLSHTISRVDDLLRERVAINEEYSSETKRIDDIYKPLLKEVDNRYKPMVKGIETQIREVKKEYNVAVAQGRIQGPFVCMYVDEPWHTHKCTRPFSEQRAKVVQSLVLRLAERENATWEWDCYVSCDECAEYESRQR